MHSDVRPTVVIVGESPPPKAPPGFVPFDCDSGTRLATKAIGLLSRAPLLAHVPRVNIFDDPGVGITQGKTWAQDIAQESADNIVRKHPSTSNSATTFVMMGNKVKAAFGWRNLQPFTWVTDKCLFYDRAPHHLVACPHPSGQNTSLNIASIQTTTRRLLIPELVAGCSGLRPWHWSLDDRAVLADLGAALCPTDPALGVAVAVLLREWADSANKQRPFSDEQYRGLATSLLGLMRAAVDGHNAVLDLWQVEGGKRRDLKARMKAVKNSGIVADYPPEVLRAIMGRYVALGVL